MKEQCLGDRRVLTQFALLELDFLISKRNSFFEEVVIFVAYLRA